MNSQRPLFAIRKYAAWQVGSRLVPGPVIVPFVNDSKLVAVPGLCTVTGIIYTGLYEYDLMAFTLHMLRPGDVFVDVGANVGTYAVLAGACAGANVIAFEPSPTAFLYLKQHMTMNFMHDAVLHKLAVGSRAGSTKFVTSLDAMNHVVASGEDISELNIEEVRVVTLDSQLQGIDPTILKIDVVGFEAEVIAGASEILDKPSLKAVLMEEKGHGSRYHSSESTLRQTMATHGLVPYIYSPCDRLLMEYDEKTSDTHNLIYLRDLSFVQQRVTSAPRFRVRGMDI